MRPFGIELVHESVEAALLLQAVRAWRTSGFFLEGEVHALMAAVLLSGSTLLASDGRLFRVVRRVRVPLASAVARLKGEEARRDEVFRKSVEAERMHGQVLQKKFDELFKQAKENPDTPPPKRDIDLD